MSAFEADRFNRSRTSQRQNSRQHSAIGKSRFLAALGMT